MRHNRSESQNHQDWPQTPNRAVGQLSARADCVDFVADGHNSEIFRRYRVGECWNLL